MDRFLPLVALLCCAPAPEPLSLGSPCNLEENPACDATQPRLLICRGGEFQLLLECKGPGRCSIAGDQVSCDFSGNSVGDRCPPSSEGKARCDPDAGAQILQCLDGGLVPAFTCAAPRQCVVADAGLTCG